MPECGNTRCGGIWTASRTRLSLTPCPKKRNSMPFELDARGTVAGRRDGSGLAREAQSGDDAHLRPALECLRYGDKRLLESCAQLRLAGAPSAAPDSR